MLDFFLRRRVSTEIGIVRVENECVFPADHYLVRLHLHTLPPVVAPGNPASQAQFKLRTSVCKWQQETFADSCANLHSLPLATGVPLRAIAHGEFYALRAKVPHGPIVNARPLVNFTTMWKLGGAHIASQYVPLLAGVGVLPCTQLASHAVSSVARLLRVLHDYVYFGFFRSKRVCLVVDDVRHACGSIRHSALRCLLRLDGFLEAVIDLLLLAARGHRVDGWVQGCQRGACVLAGRSGTILSRSLGVPPCRGPGGSFNRLG